jgi:hypothetical protein
MAFFLLGLPFFEHLIERLEPAGLKLAMALQPGRLVFQPAAPGGIGEGGECGIAPGR